MKFPEIRVTRRGAIVDRVEWDPCRDGEPLFDLTGMKVAHVKRAVDPHDIPYVEVTFIARLVEVEEEADA